MIKICCAVVLGKAKKQAQNAVCQSNMKTYGLVISMYLQENEGEFPDSYYTIFSQAQWNELNSAIGGPALTAISRWKKIKGETYIPNGALMSYLDNVVESNICPTFDSTYRRLNNQAEVSYSYSFNYWLRPGCVSKDSMVKTPAETFWAGEEAMWRGYYENETSGAISQISTHTVNDNSLCAQWPMNLNTLKAKTQDNYPPYSGTYTDCFGDFHKGSAYESYEKGQPSGGTSNAVCLDGHVQEVAPTDTYRYANGI